VDPFVFDGLLTLTLTITVTPTFAVTLTTTLAHSTLNTPVPLLKHPIALSTLQPNYLFHIL